MPYSHRSKATIRGSSTDIVSPPANQATKQAVDTSVQYLKQSRENELYTFRLKRLDLGFLFDYMYLVTNAAVYHLVIIASFVPVSIYIQVRAAGWAAREAGTSCNQLTDLYDEPST